MRSHGPLPLTIGPHLWMALVSLWFWNVVPIYWLSAQLTHKPRH